MVTTSLGTTALRAHTSAPQHQLPLLPLVFSWFWDPFSLRIALPFTPQPWSAGSHAELWAVVRGGMLCPGTRAGSPTFPEQLCRLCYLAVVPQPW